MPRHVVVAGASGLIGSALIESLRTDGVQVTRLVRRRPVASDEVEWLTDDAPLHPELVAGADAVVGLSGANIGRFPWTTSYKTTLVESRLRPTRVLADAIAAAGPDAPAFISASAVGYYGSDPGAKLTESAPRGDTFLAELCGRWEATAAGAGPQARVAMLRTAPIVHPDGVLKPLILLTRLGLSGPIGRGTQVWPWISLDDEVRAIRHVIDGDIDGPVNLCGPQRATANDLGFALAIELNRPFLVRAPVWGMTLALGSDATEAILTADMDVVPAVLAASGFEFRHPTVADAVREAVRSLRERSETKRPDPL